MSKCRSHCAACGSHFTSEAAYVSHRRGEHAKPNGHPEGRRCLKPSEDSRFVAIEGRCEMYRESVAGTLYGLARDQGRAEAHFAKRASEATGTTRGVAHAAG